MNARLTIYTEDKTSLFFNTVCRLELQRNKAQISFEEHEEEQHNRVILGINRKKITVLRIIEYFTDEDGDTEPEEDFFVLSTEKSEPSKAVIALDGIQLYFSTDFFLVRIGKSYVEAQLGCMLGLGENKTDLHKIYLKCVLSNPKDEIQQEEIFES
ncbi:MAG: hypothetical protein PHI19_03650 [Clostridia bacterium]|nr:hypothetical protein [Clostridia bacterium]